MSKGCILVLLSLVVGCGGGGSSSQSGSGTGGGGTSSGNPAPVATSLSQSSANAGSDPLTLTVTGSNFVNGSVVQWNGANRSTSFSTSSTLTAAIPAADLAFAGTAQVVVVNPAPGGGTSASLAFTVNAHVANGVSLTGDPTTLAVDATSDIAPVGVPDSAAVNGVIMNRLDLRFASSATVGQVNQALGSVGAGIVSMSKGFQSVTIGVPLQSSVAGLQAYIDKLQASPGVVAVTLGREAQTLAIFKDPSQGGATDIGHLLPGRFPAAWNAAGTTFGDPQAPDKEGACFHADGVSPMVVGDVFGSAVPQELSSNVPAFPSPAAIVSAVTHGYDVARVAIANVVGANPFPFSGCQPFVPVQVGGHLTADQMTDALAHGMPSGKFVLNFSMGFAGDKCPSDPCAPPFDVIMSPFERAIHALYWKERTSSRWGDFLVTVAAGNERAEDSAVLYPGVADARFDSAISMAEIADANDSFVNDDSLWTPPASAQANGFVSLKPAAGVLTFLQRTLADSHFSAVTADNVITVGSTVGPPANTLLTAHVTGDQLAESAFSDRNPDVLAVGEHVFGHNGTSDAAPQIAGLASFLWMVSPSLRNLPASQTRHAILDNARGKFVDAYASVLSLDPAVLPSGQNQPIRQTLLDVNEDQIFNEKDIQLFLQHFFVVAGDGTITRQIPTPSADFSRYDLNGDGFTTGGSLRERFDLDRRGSTQFGATQYTDVTQTIEGQDVHFDENNLTDLEILCYYAYSPLFMGDTDQRKSLLDGRCGVAVTPAKVTLLPGSTQQFTATLPGSDPVNWTATCGQVDSTGRFVAPAGSGTCTVRATDANDSSLSGTATVTLSSGFPGGELITATLGVMDASGAPVVPNQFATSDSDHTPIEATGLSLQAQGDFSGVQGGVVLKPAHFAVTATGVASSIDTTIAPVGTFSGTVACSASGSASQPDPDTGFVVPVAMPNLSSNFTGHVSISLPSTRTIQFTATAGLSHTTSASIGKVDGFVEVEYGDLTTGLEMNPTARIDETHPTDSVSVIQPTHGLIISWNIEALCFAQTSTTSINSARSATVTINYSIVEQ
ncbi:MAG TPA: hypothetical protein VGM84_10915 [Steroidobacteraceae bacterium]|jgi:hypothetical protein